MKFSIKHEMTGRMRVHLSQNRMTYAQADILLYFLQNDKYVTCAKVYERTGDAGFRIPEREVISFSYCRASAMKKQRLRPAY